MKFVSFAAAFLAVAFGTLQVQASVRGAESTSIDEDRKQVVIKYRKNVQTKYVFDAIEEAEARFHRQLSCIRGMVVDVDPEGLKILEGKEGLELTVSPHHKPSDEERKLVGDGDFANAMFGDNGDRKVSECKCNGLDARYYLTQKQVNMIKNMIRKNITTGAEYDCPFRYSRADRNPLGKTCISVDPVNGTLPDFRDKIGLESFEGSLGDAAGAFVRLAFHDCGTHDVREGMNENLAGCNGCADLMNNKNRGLESSTAYINELKEYLKEKKNIHITRADLIILASTVAIETTVDRVEEEERYNRLHDELPVPEKGFYRQFLDIPFKMGREDIEVDMSDGSCACEGGDLPSAEPKVLGDPFTRKDIMDTMALKWGFSLMEAMEIMGVHAIGFLKTEFSGYLGCWQFGGVCDTFSNVFYDDASNDRLAKTVNERVMIDVNGNNLTVVVTEWVRAGFGAFPFIFLNSDIVFNYDLSVRDGNGVLCNTTESESVYDIVCPRYTDDVATDFERFGEDEAGYIEWLTRFSVAYRRLTNELIPSGCGRPLFEPLNKHPNYMQCKGPFTRSSIKQIIKCKKQYKLKGKPCLCIDWE